jgi:ribose transport system substrate-binding protein
VMTNILPAHPNIDAVYGANDAETYGAITAIKAADRFQPVGKPGHIYAIGVDGSAPGINGIRDGSQDATVSQQFIKMSKMMIDDIHAKETGQAKNIPGIVWPLKVINADNINSDDVKQYGIWADDVK